MSGLTILVAAHDEEDRIGPTVGRLREGDLGWLRRRSPVVPGFLDAVFLMPLGQPTEILPSEFGWVIARRER